MIINLVYSIRQLIAKKMNISCQRKLMKREELQHWYLTFFEPEDSHKIPCIQCTCAIVPNSIYSSTPAMQFYRKYCIRPLSHEELQRKMSIIEKMLQTHFYMVE